MHPASQSLIRSVLKIGAGYLVGKGLMDDATGEIIIAGLLALFAVAWGIWQRSQQPGQSQTEKAASLILLALVLTGCQTNSGGKMLATSCQVANAAMEGWAVHVALGYATPAEEARVKEVWQKFQLAEGIAESAYLAGVRTGDMSGFDQAAAVMRSAQVDLVLLIQTFVEKKK